MRPGSDDKKMSDVRIAAGAGLGRKDRGGGSEEGQAWVAACPPKRAKRSGCAPHRPAPRRPAPRPHLQLALFGAGVQLKVRDADGGDDVPLPPGVARTVGEDDFVVALTGSQHVEVLE